MGFANLHLYTYFSDGWINPPERVKRIAADFHGDGRSGLSNVRLAAGSALEIIRRCA